MKFTCFIPFLAFVVGVATPSSEAQTNKAADIPVEVFAALPDIQSPTLSPDGTRVAYISGTTGRNQIVIQTVDGTKPFFIPPRKDDMVFTKLRWKTNNNLLFIVEANVRRLSSWNLSQEQRVLNLNLKTQSISWLGKPRRRSNMVSGVSSLGAESSTQFKRSRVIDWLAGDPQHVLLGITENNNGQEEAVRINIETGLRATVQHGRNYIHNWLSDDAGKIRMGLGRKKPSPHSARVRLFKNENGDWADSENSPWITNYQIEAFNSQPKFVIVSGKTLKNDKTLFKMDLASGEIQSQLFSHAKWSFDSLYQHPSTGKYIGVNFNGDMPQTNYTDKKFKSLQERLQLAIQGSNFKIVSSATEKNIHLILAQTPTNPGDYYLYHADKNELQKIGARRRSIDPAYMSKTFVVTIPMRDGTTIPGYITVPSGKKAHKLPTIILLEGDTESRANAQWQAMAQFFASRGYLVLRPNHRGSGGYGRNFLRAGYNQWGGLIQEDINDATRWLISKNLSGKDKVCIAGTSFGGLSALISAAKAPQLYKCVIVRNAYTDLARMKRENRYFSRDETGHKIIGLKGRNDDTFSPYQNAEKLIATSLVVTSRDAANVSYKHGRDFSNRLKKLGKVSMYFELKESENFASSKTARLKIFTAYENFLAKHIGGQDKASARQ